jgi:Fe2+ or Zn2+ uptake regulation protein
MGNSLAICTECGKTYHFEDNFIKAISEKIKEETGFDHLDTHLKVYGVCKECLKDA